MPENAADPLPSCKVVSYVIFRVIWSGTVAPVRSNRTASPVSSVFANATQLRELSGRDPWEEQGSAAWLHPAIFCFSWLLKSAPMRPTAAVFRQFPGFEIKD